VLDGMVLVHLQVEEQLLQVRCAPGLRLELQDVGPVNLGQVANPVERRHRLGEAVQQQVLEALGAGVPLLAEPHLQRVVGQNLDDVAQCRILEGLRFPGGQVAHLPAVDQLGQPVIAHQLEHIHIAVAGAEYKHFL